MEYLAFLNEPPKLYKFSVGEQRRLWSRVFGATSRDEAAICVEEDEQADARAQESGRTGKFSIFISSSRAYK